jgi:hypothetical protein
MGRLTMMAFQWSASDFLMIKKERPSQQPSNSCLPCVVCSDMLHVIHGARGLCCSVIDICCGGFTFGGFFLKNFFVVLAFHKFEGIFGIILLCFLFGGGFVDRKVSFTLKDKVHSTLKQYCRPL